MTLKTRFLLFTVLTVVMPSIFPMSFNGINVLNTTQQDASIVLHSDKSARSWSRSIDSRQRVIIPQADATEFYFSTQLHDQLCIMCSSPLNDSQSIETIILNPAEKNQFSCLVTTSTGQIKLIIGKHTKNRLPECR